MIGVSSAGELVLGEELTDLLSTSSRLGVVDLVALVQENDYIRHVDLTGEQQVLTRSEPWGRRKRR